MGSLHRLAFGSALGLVGFTLVVLPAAASQVDSWGGQIFLRHHTDVFAFPHRALEFSNRATLIYVPPTSTAGDFTRSAPSDKQDVAGVLTVGQDRWSGIIGANYPQASNPLQAHGTGSSRGWGKSLKDGDINEQHLVLGLSSSFSPMPTPKMQLGGAFQATDQVRIGAAFQQFGHEWTAEVDSAGSTTEPEKDGFDVSGYNATLSGSVADVWRFTRLEGSFSYGTSDQEEFSPIDGQGGKGDATTLSAGAVVTLDDLGVIDTRTGIDYALYGRYDRTKSDFTDSAIPGATDPAPSLDSELTGFDLRAGVVHQNTGAFATSAGIKRETEEQTFTNPGGVSTFWKRELTLFPCCDAAGEVEIGRGFRIAYGMMVFWEDSETTSTSTDSVTGDRLSQTVEKDQNVGTSYHAGITWYPTDMFRLSMTLDTDQLGDPGGAVFGNSNDAPGIAIGAQYKF